MVELTIEELDMIGYALKEMANVRACNAIDRGQPTTNADQHWKLAAKIYKHRNT
jgi:hypothetical protein